MAGVLGLSALVAPASLPVSAGMLSLDLPIMVAVAVACLPTFFTGHLIARWEGFLFLAYDASSCELGVTNVQATAAPHFSKGERGGLGFAPRLAGRNPRYPPFRNGG